MGLGALVLIFMVLAPLRRLFQQELAFDARIIQFGWHSFLMGLLVGAGGLAAVALHFGWVVINRQA